FFLLCFFMLRTPPSSPLFPYTTLFRSYYVLVGRPPFPDGATSKIVQGDFLAPTAVDTKVPRALEAVCLKAMATRPEGRYPSALRSEEHTSELQSRENLVCRLLLERKKT